MASHNVDNVPPPLATSSSSSSTSAGRSLKATTRAPQIHVTDSQSNASLSSSPTKPHSPLSNVGAGSLTSQTHLPIARYPSTQPPSHKRPEYRKTQLHRQYSAILRSSPMMLIFQHSNLTTAEWAAVRRELGVALKAVEVEEVREKEKDAAEIVKGAPSGGDPAAKESIAATAAAIAASIPRGPSVAGETRLRIVKSGIFTSALRVVEFYNPDRAGRQNETFEPTDPTFETSAPVQVASNSPSDRHLTHSLSRNAWFAAKKGLRNERQALKRLRKQQLKTSSSSSSSPSSQPSKSDDATSHRLEDQDQLLAQKQQAQQHNLSLISPLLAGPLALLTFPIISPAHLAAALSILAPDRQRFPAPRRRARPSYHEPAVQSGVQKLMLLGARIDEGVATGRSGAQGRELRRVMDAEAVRGVAGIEGGIDGLRAQLVHALQGVGVSLVGGALEGIGRSLWGVLEGRRRMLEEDGKKDGEDRKKGGEGGGGGVEKDGGSGKAEST